MKKIETTETNKKFRFIVISAMLLLIYSELDSLSNNIMLFIETKDYINIKTLQSIIQVFIITATIKLLHQFIKGKFNISITTEEK